jgi:NhaA family Na+:H+ antiporter
MAHQVQPENSTPKPFYSLETTFKRALSPLEEFLHRQSSSGIVLIICVAVALIIANSPLFPIYDHILHLPITIGAPGFSLTYSLHHWINDGLMAIFFFVIGLEVKREILIGELSDFRQALLPISAALGGMVVPAAFYLIFNHSGEALKGWGIPMATDIAFAVGIVALLGSRVPKALVAMLLALAIVDDIGAVLVIALFYTETINILPLVLAGVFLLGMIAMNLAGIRQPLPFALVGILMWLAMMKSGIHATLAGVLGAFTIPARSSFDSYQFSETMSRLAREFKEQINTDTPSRQLNVLRSSKKQTILQTIENGVHRMESPLHRLEHSLHVWVSFLVVPMFALANAGIPIEFSKLDSILLHSVTIGVIIGLVFGKTIGIYLCSWLVVKSGMSSLPQGVNLKQIFGIAILAGIGFTMSIFIGSLAFYDHPEFLLNAKIGIVFASLAAGITGYWWLHRNAQT